MITRVMPTQVSRLWDLVKPAVLELGGRIAPGDWDLANNTLNMCMAGIQQVWLMGEDGEEPLKDRFKGVVITSICHETVSKEKFLSLWLLFFYKQPSMELIREGREALKLFARENGCKVMQIQQLHSMTDQIVEKWWEGKWSKRSTYTLYL